VVGHAHRDGVLAGGEDSREVRSSGQYQGKRSWPEAHQQFLGQGGFGRRHLPDVSGSGHQYGDGQMLRALLGGVQPCDGGRRVEVAAQTVYRVSGKCHQPPRSDALRYLFGDPLFRSGQHARPQPAHSCCHRCLSLAIGAKAVAFDNLRHAVLVSGRRDEVRDCLDLI